MLKSIDNFMMYIIDVLRLALRIVVRDFRHDRIVSNVRGTLNEEKVGRIQKIG